MNAVYYYKGLYKVKVMTESEGYWIVEALEDFDDTVDGAKTTVKTGERRIVQPDELHKKKVLAPPIPEHVYERQLEKKVKRMVNKYEQPNSKAWFRRTKLELVTFFLATTWRVKEGKRESAFSELDSILNKQRSIEGFRGCMWDIV